MRPSFICLSLLLVTGGLGLGAVCTLQASVAPTDDLQPILQIIAQREQELGLHSNEPATLESGSGAVALTSALEVAKDDKLQIRTIFDTAAETVRKRVLVRRGPFNASYLETLESTTPLTQRAVSGQSRNWYAFERPGEKFLYSQAASPQGIEMEEWVYRETPPADGTLRYNWRFEPGDPSHTVSLEQNPDGSVSLYQHLLVGGVDPKDKKAQQHVMEVVHQVLQNTEIKGRDEIARFRPPVYWTRQGEKKAPELNISHDTMSVALVETPEHYPLLLDPSAQWGQWMGGGAPTGSDIIKTVAVNGNEIYAGGTADASTSNGKMEGLTFQGAYSGGIEGFVVEIDETTGTPVLTWGQWLGGTGNDEVGALVVTGDEIFAGGHSNSTTSWESMTFQGTYGGSEEGFVVKIADGASPTLNWGQWLGGDGYDYVRALAIVGDELYAGGESNSTSSWETVTFQGTFAGLWDDFVVEIADAATPTLNWGQWLGGTGNDFLYALAVTGDEIYAGGWGDPPWSITLQGIPHLGTEEGWVVEIGDGGSPTVAWGRWLGGNGADRVYSVVVDATDTNEIYAGGYSTDSTGWAFTLQGAHSGNEEGFVVEIADGGTPAWGQWLGGTNNDRVTSLGLTGDEIYAAGYSLDVASWESVTFQGAHTDNGFPDGFVVEIADGASPTLNWGQWLGGAGYDYVNAFAITGDELYAGGATDNFVTSWEPVTFQGPHSGGGEGFVVEVGDGGSPTLAWGQWVGDAAGAKMVVHALAVNGDEIYAGGSAGGPDLSESVTFQGTHSGYYNGYSNDGYNIFGYDEGFVIEIADAATPTLNWGQWLGGAGTDRVYALAVNGDEIYAGGYSTSATSWEGTFQGTYGGAAEGFVVEIADGGTPALAWGQWLGGSSSDQVTALAVTGDEIYAVGFSATEASWETVTFQGTNGGAGTWPEPFVVEIADGASPTLNWGQWIGGAGYDYGYAVAVDGDEIFVGGKGDATGGWELTLAGTQSGLDEGFVVEVDDGGSPTLAWGQWLGGTGDDIITSLAVLGDEIYAGGYSASATSWEGTFQGTFAGATEGFVVEIADGVTPTVSWGQWLGGIGNDHTNAVAVYGDEIYAGGYSSSPTSWEISFQGTFGILIEGFVVEIADGASPTLNWAQWLGGNGNDAVNALAVTKEDRVVAGGYADSSSTDLTGDGFTMSGTKNSGDEGFVAVILDDAATSAPDPNMFLLFE